MRDTGTGLTLLVLLTCSACAVDERVVSVPDNELIESMPGAAGSANAAGSAGASGSDVGSAPLTLTWPPAQDHLLAINTERGCVLRRDASLACWGDPLSDLTRLPPPEGRFTHLSAMVAAACGLREDGTIACWDDLELNGTPAPSGVFARMDVGVQLGCGIALDGNGTCWGRNVEMSQLPAGSYRAVGAGRRSVCGIDAAGALLCRGEIRTPPGGGPFAVLSVGDGEACALREDRTLACWGNGGPGEPTDGSDPTKISWGQAIPPPGEFVFVATGAVHSCALRADGEAVCWGAGKSNGDCQANVDACGMSLPPPGPFVEIAAGLTNTCALRPDRSVTCWGSNTGNRSTPPPGPQ